MMGLSIMRQCASGAGNNLLITSSVLFLVAGFVADSWGKPFNSVGQDEVEEDTSQGSLKDQFPPNLLLSPAGLADVVNVALATDPDDVDGQPDWRSGYNNNDDGKLYVDLHDAPSYSTTYKPRNLEFRRQSAGATYPVFETGRGITGAGGLVRKRSLGLIHSASSDEDRKRFPPYFPSTHYRRPTTLVETASAESSGASSSSSDPPTSSENPGFRFRQKLLNLRNQYGDQWLAYVSPYAYRKRQILYRQCFFNPISCF